MTTKNNYVNLWGHKITPKLQENTKSFLKIIFGDISPSWTSRILESLEKTRTENPEDPSNEILKKLNIGAMFIQKHEMEQHQEPSKKHDVEVG